MTPRPATAQPAQYPRLMTAAHRCLVDLMTSVPALDPHVWFEQRQGAFGMVTHVPFPTLNGVWLHDSSATTSDVTELLDALPAEGMMHCLQAAPGVRESATAIAEARGMTPGPDVPLMVLDRVPAEVKTSGLRIPELARPEFDLRTEVAAAAFETDPADMRAATALFSRVPGYRMYIGDVDCQPVTTAVSIATGEGVGIFDVATPPEHRGHGYGAAVTAHAIRDGMAGGARFSWLQSSPEGYGVYERLGFVTVEQWGLWIAMGHAE